MKTEWVLSLARPAVRNLKPYSSARSLVSGEGETTPVRAYLDANEYAGDGGGAESSRGWNRYPSPQPKELKTRLAALFGARVEELLVTRGSDESIDCLSRAFLSEGKDAVVVCPPTYGVYEVSARLQGAEVLSVPLRAEDGFSFDAPAIAETVRRTDGPRAKIVYLCSPNNPTGAGYDPEALLSIAKACEGRALVVVDEAYCDFSPRGSVLPRLGAERFDAYPGLVVLRTLSKAWGLAGLRIGAAIGNPETIALLAKTLAPYPLPAPAVEAALRTIERVGESGVRSRVKALLEERERVARALRALPRIERIYPSEANFLLFRSPASAAILRSAKSAGVILRDRSGDPALANCIRMTIGTPEENDLALSAIGEATRA